MSEISGANKKIILSDPVMQYANSNPQATEEQKTALSKLQQQYIELKKQHEETQHKCKGISRQIGEAKREGQSTENLMQAMQAQSSRINSVKDQLNKISEKIFNYFKSANDTDNTKEQAAELPPVRGHTERTSANEQIYITLLTNEDDAWNQYVESSSAASLYHRTEWKQLINNVFGHECYYFYASNNNKKITGILPLVRLKSRLFGDFMVSMPYFNIGGAVANSMSIEQNLMQAANKYAEKIGSNHIEYRDDISRPGLAVRSEKVNMVLSLPDNKDNLWADFTAKLRSQIKRPMREKTLVRVGGEENLDDFYDVFSRNMRDLGTPVYNKSFFSKILQQFPEHSKIIIVHLNNRPVAAAFLLGYKDTLEIPWASTIKDVNHLSMNMLLYWEVLKFAIKNQYQYFDFGRSSKDSGTFRFKQQWGAKPKQMYWHYWLPENVELPRLNPDNPKFALAIRVWKKIPVIITKWLGPLIVKNLP